MSVSRRVKYDALDASSTRVIDLLPGDQSAPISCRLRHIDIRNPSAYEAISYVWGEPNDKVAITCDGAEIDVHRNLYAALCRFRRPNDARSLWADYICINQEDLDEQSRQVLLMCDIYSKATEVLVWLGDATPDDNTYTAIDSMNMIYRQIWSRREELNDFKTKSILDQHQEGDPAYYWHERGPRNVEAISTRFGIPGPDSSEFISINQFWEKPWFHRAWTFQESHVATAKRFFCGAWEMPTLMLIRVLVILRALHHCTDDDRYLHKGDITIAAMITGRSYWSPGNQSFNTFLPILSLRRGAGCTRPSDLIYCLLRSSLQCPELIPDYTKSFWQVFAEATFQTILKMKNFKIFGNVDFRDEESPLPSWVPDWRLRPTDSESFTLNTEQRYKCSGSSVPIVELTANGKELSITGILWDHVTTIITSDDHPGYMEDLKTQIGQTYEPTQESLSDAWLRTTCTDLTLYEEDETRWTASSTSHCKELRKRSNQNQANSYGAFIKAMAHHQGRRPFIVTKAGRLGLSTRHVREGDIIAIILGSEVPLLLRGCGDGKYRLVGECYVHGFMDGEALADARKKRDSLSDYSRTDWLEHLLETPLPFDAVSFDLI